MCYFWLLESVGNDSAFVEMNFWHILMHTKLMWEVLYKPKTLEGLGFRDSLAFNMALMAKQGCHFCKMPSSSAAPPPTLQPLNWAKSIFFIMAEKL
jgi:hypothetical protein